MPITAIFLLALMPTAAHAYIDSGSGAYMVQALIALIASGLFYLRNPIQALKNLWTRIRRRKE